MKPVYYWIVVIFVIGLFTFFKKGNNTTQTKNQEQFEVVGYLFWSEGTKSYSGRSFMNTQNIPYEYLTTIIYAFVLPDEDASGNLMPLMKEQEDSLHALVKEAHKHNVKVLISIGGFNIGDGPGVDKRFEFLANRKESRNTFVKSSMDWVRKFDLDGIDIDWEFPDAVEPSLSNYTLLMKELADSLHPKAKLLATAVESHRRPYTYCIDEEVFKYVDLFNIMSYDGNVGETGSLVGQLASPYWLGEISFDLWVDERGLPKEKAIMGTSFGRFRSVVSKGGDPFSDTYNDSTYYTGLKTIKKKARIAKKRGGGIMIWTITGDTTGEYSLLRAINEVLKEE